MRICWRTKSGSLLRLLGWSHPWLPIQFATSTAFPFPSRGLWSRRVSSELIHSRNGSAKSAGKCDCKQFATVKKLDWKKAKRESINRKRKRSRRHAQFTILLALRTTLTRKSESASTISSVSCCIRSNSFSATSWSARRCRRRRKSSTCGCRRWQKSMLTPASKWRESGMIMR